jgi:hypothetical protein
MTTPSNGTAPTSPGLNTNGERRSSFNFLRQQSKNGNKMMKKQKGQSQQQQHAANIPRVPPQLPSHSPLPKINSFGGDNGRPDSYAILANQYSNQQPGSHAMSPQYNHNGSMSPHAVPMPPMPSSPPTTKNGEYDPYSRSESMTHRGRYSYASSAVSTATGINSPRRVRRRKDPTPFK